MVVEWRLSVLPAPGAVRFGDEGGEMAERDLALERREVRLPDGRRLIYYPCPEDTSPPGEPPVADPTAAPPIPTAGGER